MKKYLTLLFLLITSVCFGQSKYLEEITSKPFSNKSFDFRDILVFGDMNNPKQLFISADSGTKKISNVIPYPFKAKTSLIYLEGATNIKLFSYIPKDSLKYYRYSVFNGDVIVPGKKDLNPIAFYSKGIGASFNKDRADFGSYMIANQNLFVSFYKIGNKQDARTIIIINKKIMPAKIVGAGLVEGLKIYKNPKVTKLEKNGKGDTIYIEKEISSRKSTNLNIHGRKLSFNEDVNYVEINIEYIDNSFLYKILMKSLRGNESFIDLIDDMSWNYNENGTLSTRIDKKYFEKPGKYELIIYPKIGILNAEKPESATAIKFEIVASDFFNYKQVATLLTIVAGILVGIAVLIIYYIKTKSKRKLIKEKQQKDIAKTQLESIRSQLNPHFMFNALAGIQSLMNEEKTNEANQYLGRFARITRNVLDNKELISIAEEEILLDDYLQMEQLRFGFKYKIEIQQDVDLNIEIPSMLLQPFVENAVKHGIADKGKDGEISIDFIKKDNNLVLELRDNGKGFDTSKTYAGYGLQLSENRMLLLNSIYKENTLVLNMDADENGTVIKITLKDWL